MVVVRWGVLRKQNSRDFQVIGKLGWLDRGMDGLLHIWELSKSKDFFWVSDFVALLCCPDGDWSGRIQGPPLGFFSPLGHSVTSKRKPIPPGSGELKTQQHPFPESYLVSLKFEEESGAKPNFRKEYFTVSLKQSRTLWSFLTPCPPPAFCLWKNLSQRISLIREVRKCRSKGKQSSKTK